MDEYVLAFVMAGGRGSRLKILTKHRTKPAVGFLGHYRIFDFVATNVVNSGINSMIVAAQFEPRSLVRHIGAGRIWGFDGIDKTLEINHPHEKEGKIVRFKGTADSVKKSMDRIKEHDPRIVLVLGGDHIYAMDYKGVIKQHSLNNADVTIMASAIKEDKINDFGIIKVDETGKILDFIEKPTNKKEIERFRLNDRIKSSLGINKRYDFLASMGNYVFFRDRLENFLEYKGIDFGHHIIPKVKEEGGSLYAYPYNGYWRDVGKIEDYFDCNMDFISKNSPINLLKHRIRTMRRHLPAPRIAKNAQVKGSILTGGNEIQTKSKILNCVFGYQVVIDEGCELDQCILLGADRNKYYQNRLKEYNITFIGAGTKIKKTIIDKNVKIGSNVQLSPEFGNPKERRNKLIQLGLEPYREKEDGKIIGDFYIEPTRNILVIGKRIGEDKEKIIIPDNFKV